MWAAERTTARTFGCAAIGSMAGGRAQLRRAAVASKRSKLPRVDLREKLRVLSDRSARRTPSASLPPPLRLPPPTAQSAAEPAAQPPTAPRTFASALISRAPATLSSWARSAASRSWGGTQSDSLDGNSSAPSRTRRSETRSRCSASRSAQDAHGDDAAAARCRRPARRRGRARGSSIGIGQLLVCLGCVASGRRLAAACSSPTSARSAYGVLHGRGWQLRASVAGAGRALDQQQLLDARRRRRRRPARPFGRRLKKIAALTGVAVVSGVAIGVTAGLAAPAVVSASSRRARHLGGGAAAIGGGMAATAGVLRRRRGRRDVSSVFGVSGAGLAAWKMERRLGDLSEFAFEQHGNRARSGLGRDLRVWLAQR